MKRRPSSRTPGLRAALLPPNASSPARGSTGRLEEQRNERNGRNPKEPRADRQNQVTLEAMGGRLRFNRERTRKCAKSGRQVEILPAKFCAPSALRNARRSVPREEPLRHRETVGGHGGKGRMAAIGHWKWAIGYRPAERPGESATPIQILARFVVRQVFPWCPAAGLLALSGSKAARSPGLRPLRVTAGRLRELFELRSFRSFRCSNSPAFPQPT